MGADPFTVIILGGTAGLFIALVLLGLFYPGNGTEQLRWQMTRSAETEAQNEVDDLDQMLAATNARRAARGRTPLTEASLRAELTAEEQERSASRDDKVIELELVQMLERKNERRRNRGLPEITREDWMAKMEAEGRR